MHSYAQTNLQLYNQIIEAKYSDADLTRTFQAYELAMKLFSGRYRANGKPFVAHSIGTASILITQSSPVSVVVAGLLHAAYAQGDFGNRQYGITQAKQKYLAQLVGEEVESIVALYTSLAWDEQAISIARSRINELSQVERQVLLIRLANDLEDELDLGMLYCKKAQNSTAQLHTLSIVEVALELGYPLLAEQLVESLQRAKIANIPSMLQREKGSSFTISPGLREPFIFALLKSIKHMLTNKVVTKLMQAWRRID
ncbi:DUF6817 domain-containing protein [Mastigocoleus testarum]|uniref:DUF6817 domain-containing protein n=1 Tax=Mastigocoleus testarum BC008 TaxID=371196 RepID=A0A0V7ZT69_9CYAN|nr:HD domain-containing protein [Mastigocoleus testarum]KST67398.1 hypothetical protein BC008_29840 [Mastigocoleus testarum BC008]